MIVYENEKYNDLNRVRKKLIREINSIFREVKDADYQEIVMVKYKFEDIYVDLKNRRRG